VICKGVEFVATAEPNIFEWRFAIGDKIKTGKTQTRLVALALGTSNPKSTWWCGRGNRCRPKP